MALEQYRLTVYRFYQHLYEIVNDPSTDSIISWSKSNKSFIIWNHQDLIRRKFLSRLYCRTFSDFLIKLKSTGFNEIKGSASGPWEFGNNNFVRGRPELLADMYFKVALFRMKERSKARKAKAEINDRLQNLKI